MLKTKLRVGGIRQYLLTIALALVFCLLALLFYLTPFREEANGFFYDLVTRLKPRTSPVERVHIIEISEQSIQRLHQGRKTDLQIEDLIVALDDLFRLPVKAIAVLLYANIFDYGDPRLKVLVDQILRDPRVFVGIINFHDPIPWGKRLPAVFHQISDRVGGVDTFKKRSNSMLRRWPMYGYLEDQRVPMLGSLIGTYVHPDRKTWPDQIVLNYMPFESIPRTDIADFIANPTALNKVLQDKVVVLGYSAFRSWPLQTAEQLSVNTPLKSNPDSFTGGDPIVFAVATALENILTDSYLRIAPRWIVFLQTLSLALFFAWVWRLGSVMAGSLVLIAFTFLLWAQSRSYAYLNLRIDMADTFFFGGIVVMIAAVRRVGFDLMSLGTLRGLRSAKLETMLTQSKSLSAFAHELLQKVAAIAAIAKRIAEKSYNNATLDKLLKSFVLSSEEFRDYLFGIEQLAVIEDKAVVRARKVRFDLVELIQTILERFASQLHAKQIKVRFDTLDQTTMVCNRMLLDMVLYNLISNAIKYTPPQSEIGIKIQVLRWGRITVSVSDQGPGIADEHKEKIFEKFYRIKDERLYQVKGTGLGLYLVQYFCGVLRARVDVKSQPGRGTEFILTMQRG